MKGLVHALLLLVCSFVSLTAQAQDSAASASVDSSQVYRVSVKDGSVYVGTILFRDANKLVMKTATIPRIEISVLDLVRIEEVKSGNYKRGVYWFENPHTSRYYYGPSAIPLKKGEGYYQNTWLLLNSFNVGITENISVGGGFELISLLGAGMINERGYNPIFFLTPKVGFKVSDNFHAGGGLLYINVPTDGDGSRGSLGITYGVATYGSSNHNLSAGLGWGFVEGYWSASPAITLSGTTRVSKRLALMTENWLLPSEQYFGIYSYGIRVLGENTAFDLALVLNADIATVWPLGFPFVSYTVKF